MRHIDADTITQAVIARYASAGDARLREVMTSLVQHLHAFARDMRLTEAEWAEGVRFLADSGRDAARGRPELGLLSDSLGLTALVTAVNQRKPKGCTEATLTVPWLANGVPHRAGEGPGKPATCADACAPSTARRSRVPRFASGCPAAIDEPPSW